MNTIKNTTAMDWANEYVNAIDNLKTIITLIKGTNETDLDEAMVSKYTILISANKAIKEEAERHVMDALESMNCDDSELIALLEKISPYLLAEQ